MESFEEKTKNLGEQYYNFFVIPVTPTYSPTQTQMHNGEYEKNEQNGEDKVEVRDRANKPEDV